jgi:hypothetical protein
MLHSSLHIKHHPLVRIDSYLELVGFTPFGIPPSFTFLKMIYMTLNQYPLSLQRFLFGSDTVEFLSNVIYGVLALQYHDIDRPAFGIRSSYSLVWKSIDARF